MGQGIIILTVVPICLLFDSIFAQNHLLPSYRSPSLGQLVMHPEALSGVWEAPDGNGGTVGVHLRLITMAPADVNTLNGVPQTWQSLTDRSQSSFPPRLLEEDAGQLLFQF